MKYPRRLAALVGALALSAVLAATPALATDVPNETTDVPGTGDTSSQVPVETPPPTPTPPTPEPPSSSSSEEPSSSVPEPPSSSSEDPSSSSEPPSSSEGGESSSSSGEEVPSSSDPSSEDPWVEPEPEPTEDPWAGAIVDEPDPTPSATLPSIGDGGASIATPRPSASTPRPALERPRPSLNDGSSAEEEEATQPNYVTFAQLNVRGNSLAATVFYGGVACIALGVAGLALILALYLRGRRHARGDGLRDGILEEIHEAETRQMPPPAAPAPEEPVGDLPQAASLYTEELPLPQNPYGGQEAVYPDPDYPEEAYYPEKDAYDPQGPAYEAQGEADPYPEDFYAQGAYAPQEYLDDHETDIPEESYQEPVPYEEEPLDATKTFDTEEILREALGFGKEEQDPSQPR